MAEPIQAPADTELPVESVAIPPEGAPDGELIAALVAALIAGAAVDVLARILGRFAGLTTRLAGQILRLQGWDALLRATAEELSILPRYETPAVRVLHQGATVAAFRRATYLINASRRLAPAVASGDVDRIYRAQATEARYLEAHLQAEDRRGAATLRVAETVAPFGVDKNGELLLGWKATLDSKTSADCRWANGRNFNALQPPPIGYPGTVHLWCRCRPVPPYPTKRRVEHGTPPVH